jgi:hypothetical protein
MSGPLLPKLDKSVEAIIAQQHELNAIIARDARVKEEEGLQAASKIEDPAGPYTLVNKVSLW